MALSYCAYPAPQPLEKLWSRPDLGAVLMCGYPIALRLAPVIPIAAPIPRADWAGRPRGVSLRPDRARAMRRTARLEDTFGAPCGLDRHAFAVRIQRLAPPPAGLPHARSGRRCTREMVGNLVTARNVLDSVRAGRIDVGPLDAYWHMLIARHAPAAHGRACACWTSTALAPMPAFVAAGRRPAEMIARLRAAFVGAARQPWFAPFAERCCSRASPRSAGSRTRRCCNGTARRGRRDSIGRPEIELGGARGFASGASRHAAGGMQRHVVPAKQKAACDIEVGAVDEPAVLGDQPLAHAGGSARCTCTRGCAASRGAANADC